MYVATKTRAPRRQLVRSYHGATLGNWRLGRIEERRIRSRRILLEFAAVSRNSVVSSFEHMLTEPHMKEALSRAYVAAVAARAGLNSSTQYHDYGVDCSVHEVVVVRGKRMNSGVSLDLQLKATQDYAVEDSSIVYDLEVATYNGITWRHSRSTSARAPCILAVLCLSREQSGWLTVSENELVLRRCCYWVFLEGDRVVHRRTVRIRVPRENLLSPDALRSLLARAKKGWSSNASEEA